MIFNKNSKLLKISAFIKNDYSDNIAYGELYLPYKTNYLENKIKNNLIIYCHTIDKQYPRIPVNILFKSLTFEELIRDEQDPSYPPYTGKDIEDVLYDKVSEILDFNYHQKNKIYTFNTALSKLYGYPRHGDIRIELELDTKIQGNIVPKGTIIEFEGEINQDMRKISDDWRFEFNF